MGTKIIFHTHQCCRLLPCLFCELGSQSGGQTSRGRDKDSGSGLVLVNELVDTEGTSLCFIDFHRAGQSGAVT